MSFYDHGVVVFRFGRSRNESYRSIAVSYLLVKGGLWFVSKDGDSCWICRCIFWIFYTCTSRDEHWTISGSVRRLLTLLAVLVATTAVMDKITKNGLLISFEVFLTIFMTLFLPPFIFVNFKLFIIVRKVHNERAVSPEKRTKTNLKNISTGLWVVAGLMLLSIPDSVYIAFSLAEKSTNTVRLSYIWMLTCVIINCTLNSLIFFWKNKVLRTEGIKILKTLKDRLVGFQARTALANCVW